MVKRRNLRGAVVLITGASSGIGRATALAFAAEGARLVLASRSGEALAEVEQDCRARGGQVLVVPTDIADPAGVERLARTAQRRFGRIDVWVEAVAVGVAGPLGSEAVDEIRRLVDINVFGTVLCARAALAAFRAQDEVRYPGAGPEPSADGRRRSSDTGLSGVARAGRHAVLPAGREPFGSPAAGYPARVRA